MNISQRIIELEKGCGKEIYSEVYYNTHHICGDNRLCEECSTKLQLLKEIKEDVLNSIDFICETEGWTNHDNPEHIITIRRLKECVKQNLIGETK